VAGRAGEYASRQNTATGLPLIRQWFLTHRLDQTLTTAADVFRAFTLAHRQELFPRLSLP
jgi:hypothetical protein